MAGHARYTALLDACVLFPVAVCDALMSVQATRIFAAKWTDRIDEEWMRSLEAQRCSPSGTFIARRDAMRRACPDWEVPAGAWQPLEACVDLPDAGDRHVLAAAMAGHADCIVTANIRDFPLPLLSPLGIEPLHPDTFLVAQLELEPVMVLAAFKKMRARLQKPECTPEVFAQSLERNGLAQTATFLRDAAELI